MLGSFPGTNFELPILILLLLLGCSNIPNPGHLSLCWLFFKAVGFIPASEGPSTPSLCPSASSGVSTWGSPLCRASVGLLGRFGARRLSSSWDVLVRADACAASVWLVVRAPEPGMSMSCGKTGKMLY